MLLLLLPFTLLCDKFHSFVLAVVVVVVVACACVCMADASKVTCCC